MMSGRVTDFNMLEVLSYWLGWRVKIYFAALDQQAHLNTSHHLAAYYATAVAVNT